MADLPANAPPPVQIVGTRTPEEVTSVFGDIVLTGGATPPRRASTVFGDIRIDLRGLRTDADRIDLYVSTVFGDIDVIVAEGVDAELQGRTVLGDRKVVLAAVQRLAGTPLIVVHAKASSATSGCAAWPRGLAQPVGSAAGAAGAAEAAASAYLRRRPSWTRRCGRRARRSRRAASPASAGSRSSGWCPTASA